MSIYNIKLTRPDGSTQSMSAFKGKVILIVNTATKCGFTPQYDDLRDLYEKFHDKDFELLDFPCNQFGEQAPGTDEEIQSECVLRFNTPYIMYKKIDVNGENETELYKFLKSKKGFEGFNNENDPRSERLHNRMFEKNPDYAKSPDIKWNFTKFLVDRNGEVVYRFEPVDEMKMVEEKIKELL